MTTNGRIRLFDLGQIVATPGLLDVIRQQTEGSLEAFCAQYIDRHARGDWSEMVTEDQAANRQALIDGSRIFSAYKLPDGQKIWIITEANRSVTTLLLPSEY